MAKNNTSKQNLYVRASMFTANELRRQKRLGLNEINEDLLTGLVEQRKGMEDNQATLSRSLILSLFLAFVAWSGGNIQIPGTGASIAEVPAFLELSLIVSAFCIMLITFTFLSIQMYNGVIFAVTKSVLAKERLDPELFMAAHAPAWLFIKYSQYSPIVGREPVYKVSRAGSVFFEILTGSLFSIILILWFLALASVLYMAHFGLSDNLAGWVVYLTCVAMIITSIICMLANKLEFTNEVDFSVLEVYETHDDDPRPRPPGPPSSVA